MDAYHAYEDQREPLRQISARVAGFTLLEVMIAAGLAVAVIAGLAAASLSAARTNREAATLGAAERALHETLEYIANDLRTNNGEGPYRCDQPTRPLLPRNGYQIEWRTYRVTLDANGDPTQQTNCDTVQHQGTLLVRAMTRDGNIQHTRETLVSLTRGATQPNINYLTTNLTEVRPGDNVTITWQLANDPPAGTATYLNGERVHTDPTTLSGTTTRQITETTTLELVADSPFGTDQRNVTINAGDAPIFRVLRTTPERYIPGDTLTFHWEIDPAPLTLTTAQRLAANGVGAANLPTNGSSKAVGQHPVTIPSGSSGTLTFPFTATSAGGTTRTSIAVQECPSPTINLTANPNTINHVGRIDSQSTISWALTNATNAALTIKGNEGTDHARNLTGDELTSGSYQQHIYVPQGNNYQYTVTLTATNDCGSSSTRENSREVTISAISDEPPPPPPEPDPDPNPGPAPEGPEEPDPNLPDPVCPDVPGETIYCACFPEKVLCI